MTLISGISICNVKDNKSAIKMMLSMEKQIKELRNQIVEELCGEIKSYPMPNVKVLSGNAVMVPASIIFGSKSLIFSPDYYIQERQADAVRHELEKAETIEEMSARIGEMVRSRAIRTKDGAFMLNNNTIEVLMSNELYDLAAISA